MEKQNQITEGSITKQLILFFIPIWIGTFFQQLYNTVDAIIVGNYLNKQALSAVGGPTTNIINLLVGFFVGLGAGAGVIISQFYGAKDYKKTSKAIHTAIAIAVVSGIFLTVAGMISAPYLLKGMHVTSDIYPKSVTYLEIYFGGIIFSTYYNLGSGILRALGDSRRPLYFLMVSSIVNIFLDLLFIKTMGMGVEGAAIGTVISQAVSCVLVTISLMKLDERYRLHIKKIRIDIHIFAKMIKIGVPAGMQSVLFSISNVVIQSGVNLFGTDTIAAWTAYMKIDSIYWMALQSLGTAVTTFVGQNFGAGKKDRIKKCVRIALIIATVMALVIGVLFITFKSYLFRMFTQDENVIKIGKQIVVYMVPFYATFMFVEILSGTMRGIGNVIIPMIITCLGVCVFRLIWFVTAFEKWTKLFTICMSYPISWVMTSTCFIIYYNISKRKRLNQNM